MIKIIGTLGLLLIVAFSIVTASAQNGNSNPPNGNSNSNGQTNRSENGSSNSKSNSGNKNNSATAGNQGNNNRREASASATCAPEAQWKNHGDYVSCVARLKLGGATTSAAARSDIGKKSASTSGTPKPTSSSSATPIASISSSPVATTSASISDIQLEVLTILANIQLLFERLKNLLPFN